MTRDDLRAALLHPNVRAFLRVIREGESSQSDSAYTTMFGGRRFTSFAAHPKIANTAAGLTSTAAGAYQFLWKTWAELVKQYGFDDFSPATQDEGAVALIHRRKALDSLKRGDFADVLDRCSWEWASLPPGRYGQPTIDAKRAYAVYEKWGGKYQPAPEVTEQHLTITEPPMAPFIAAALPSIIAAVPDLLTLFGDRKKESSKQYAEAAQKVVDIAIKATGAANAQEAAEKIGTDPAAADAVREAVREQWFELSEAGGGGIAAAREFNLKATEAPFWKMPAFWITLTLLPLLYGTVFIVLTSTQTVFSGELRAAIASSVVTGILGGVLGFWLGSSFTTSKSRGLGATASQ